MIKILVCFFAGLGAGLGTGFAGMSAAAVISPMLITFLNMPAYEAVGIALASDVLACTDKTADESNDCTADDGLKDAFLGTYICHRLFCGHDRFYNEFDTQQHSHKGAVSHFAIGGAPDLWCLILCMVFTLLWARIAALFANRAALLSDIANFNQTLSKNLL